MLHPRSSTAPDQGGYAGCQVALNSSKEAAMRATASFSLLVGVAAVAARTGHAQCTGTPSDCGSWSQRYTWFDQADGKGEIVHLSLLPTGPAQGRVLLWRANWPGDARPATVRRGCGIRQR